MITSFYTSHLLTSVHKESRGVVLLKNYFTVLHPFIQLSHMQHKKTMHPSCFSTPQGRARSFATEHAHSSLPKRPNDTRTVNEVSPSSLFLCRRVAKASEQQNWPSERAIDVDADTGSR